MNFGSIIHAMVIDMNESQLKTVAQLRASLAGTLEVKFRPIRNDLERYGFIASVLGRFAYPQLSKADKGVLMLYLARTTDYSRAQLRRLVCRRFKGEKLAKRYRAPAVGFARKFTTADVKLLAQTDALHNNLILASQFGSFLQPVAIMMSLPLSLIGVLLALLIARSTLNIFSIIGFVMLMGLVTKNAILLVDFANQLRAAGRDRVHAVLEAGRIRLRPILMTTFAMVFGMIPLALGIGEGSEQRAPMAHAVIGGIITSTLLTLVVVPVIYTYLDDVANWAQRKFGSGRTGAGAQPVRDAQHAD